MCIAKLPKQTDPTAAVQPLETQIEHSRRWQGDRVARVQGGREGIRGRRKFDACKIPNDLESR